MSWKCSRHYWQVRRWVSLHIFTHAINHSRTWMVLQIGQREWQVWPWDVQYESWITTPDSVRR